MSLDNERPTLYTVSDTRPQLAQDWDEDVEDPVDQREIFDLLRDINDPEHPLTLEQLNVVQLDGIKVQGKGIDITFTPTIPHCSMASLIGLCLRVKLERSLPPAGFKLRVRIAEGSHDSEEALNKQLADKERVAAALENAHLMQMVNQCLTKNK